MSLDTFLAKTQQKLVQPGIEPGTFCEHHTCETEIITIRPLNRLSHESEGCPMSTRQLEYILHGTLVRKGGDLPLYLPSWYK